MTFSSHGISLIVRFLGFSHLLIAIGAGVSATVALNVLGLNDRVWHIAAFISSCTGLGYSVQRLVKAKLSPSSVQRGRLEFLQKFGGRLVVVWSCVWFVGFLWVVEELDFVAWLVLLGLGVAGLCYAILPGPLSRWARSVREVPGMKLPVLSVVWGCATVVVPLLMLGEWGSVEPGMLWGVVIARVMYIAGLTIPFDVRDLNVDGEEMRTVPMVWGVVNSLWWACILALITGGIWACLGEIPLACHAIATALLVSPKIYKPYRGEWYYSLVLDGMLISQAFVLCY